MNDLNAASGAAEQLAPVVTETPEVVTPEATDDAGHQPDSTDATGEKTPEQKELERLRRQLTKRDRTQGKLHQELQAERQAREALERRMRESAPEPDDGEPQRIDPKEIDRLIKEEAKRQTQAERLNEKANAIYERGSKKFGDFDQVIRTVNEEAPLFTERGPTPLMEAIFDSDAPEAVLHYLGQNPDIAADLADLTPTQIARRLVRIETEVQEAAKPKQSAAPKPLAPVKATATSSTPDPKKDPEAWIKWRNEQTNR